MCWNHDINAVNVLDFSSPSLKKLILTLYRRFENVTIIVTSNSLQSLDYFWRSNGFAKLTINTPNLKYLAISGPDLTRLTVVGSLYSVVAVEIELEVESDQIPNGKDLTELLRRVKNVQSIRASVDTLQALHSFPHLLPTFEDLLNLKINGHRRDDGLAWKALPSVLKNAPNLEVLVLENIFWSDEEVKCPVKDIFPAGLIENLKEIELKDYCRDDFSTRTD
ncbi:OLC1v1015942C1 [Oldenlandia corymbosa var. corymbosa]|uniref:OLC1v1015942C1 n=1 Tax=Oldenlandia corymbosa var. corymbosa TaxID=529605 RepID=A0AAV1E750_OLDCO|nr:OLC1v1015942C1 [Oldenlandia corymbosa var. corymbosa]